VFPGFGQVHAAQGTSAVVNIPLWVRSKQCFRFCVSEVPVLKQRLRGIICVDHQKVFSVAWFPLLAVASLRAVLDREAVKELTTNWKSTRVPANTDAAIRSNREPLSNVTDASGLH
jgi:hypothetical protein